MLSQRKRRSSPAAAEQSEDLFNEFSQQTQATKSKRKKDNKNANLFKQIISKAGFILSDGDRPNELDCDQAMFQKELKKLLRHHDGLTSEEIIEKIMKHLDEHLEDRAMLKRALLYTETVPDCSTARGSKQDSLIRLLLNIDSVQPPLINLLTEILLSIAHDDQLSDRVELSLLILANLRWLDHIVDATVLTEKIIDLLHGSPLQIQREVVNVVADIIDDDNHPNIAKELCELYENSECEELVPSVIEALSYLTLQPDCLVQVHHSVLKRINATDMEHLPLVVKFLLHNTTQNMMHQVLSDIRESIELASDYSGSPNKSQRRKLLSSSQRTASSSQNNQLIDYKLLLISNIEMIVLVKKYIPKIWLKVIDDITDCSNIRAFDLLVLFLLYEAIPSCSRVIEKIFRNKIRKGLSTDALLSTFKDHISIIKKYNKSIKSLAGVFIRSSGLSVSHYGAAIYRYLFIYLDGYHQQDIVSNLLSHLGDNDNVKSIVLSLISELTHEHTTLMVKYTISLKGSLDVIEHFDLRDAKKLIDAICLLAFSTNDHSSVKDEIFILIRKQLSHPDIIYKRLGVLSAVLAMKNMLMEDEPLEDESSGIIKECKELFELVVQSTSSSYAATALFMDELASTVLKEGVNQNFENLINKKVTDDFIDNFLVDFDPNEPPSTSYKGYSMALRWSLEPDNPTIYVNLGPMLVNAEETRSDADNFQHIMMIMGPQFRLVRMIESRLHEGDLGNIDALLGSPIYLPSVESVAKFSSLSIKEQHVILSCYFYNINWFRELINAFATQKDPELKKKVFSRLRQLIQLQNKLCELLPECPSYEPHLADFNFSGTDIPNPVNLPANKRKSSKKPKGKTASKSKDKDQTSTQLPSQTQPTGTQTQREDKEDSYQVNLDNYRHYLRELHIDVFNLLFKSLEIDINSEAHNKLSLAEAEFLLEDFNRKLSHAFIGQNKSCFGNSKRDTGFSHLDLFNASEIAEYTYFLLKPVCVHLETISGLYQELLESSDGIMDASSLYTKHLIPVSRVYTSLFTIIANMVSWSGLQLEQNRQTLNKILRVIAKRINNDIDELTTDELLTTAFRYISKFADSVINIKTAAVLVEVLQALCFLDESCNLKSSLLEVIEKFLKNLWYNTDGVEDSGAVFNKRVCKLLKVYIGYSNDMLDTVNVIVFDSLHEFVEDPRKKTPCNVYQTLTKGSLVIYYSTILEHLVPAIKKGLLSAAADNQDKLSVWQTSITVYDMLASLLDIYDNRLMLLSCLNHSRGFIELFLNKAMPLFDRELLHDHHLVIALFKKLQKSTRKLQHICTHSKAKKDSVLMRNVPKMKKLLESLLFRVKAMLVKNNCFDVFWMGNLKNRDLKGKEICNDTSRIEAEESEEKSVTTEDDAAETEEMSEEEESEVDLNSDEEDSSKNDGAVTEFSRSF